jgi:hypothetical protein
MIQSSGLRRSGDSAAPQPVTLLVVGHSTRLVPCGPLVEPAVLGAGSVPYQWANAIRVSVDQLLAMETELLTTYGSKDRGTAALDKAAWPSMITRYWSA